MIRIQGNIDMGKGYNLEKFKNIIEQTITVIKEFTEIEQTKLDAAADENLTALEGCMTKEQAMILRVKGLEQERDKWQKKNGYGGMTFRQILEQAEPAEKAELQPLFDQLSGCLKTFQDVMKSAEQIIKTNLHTVNKKLELRGMEYQRDGSTEKFVEGHLTDRKV